MSKEVVASDNTEYLSYDELVKGVSLDPGGSKDLFLGFYERSMPILGFALEFEPEAEKVEATLERIDSAGDYSLVYHLKNSGSKRCSVTIREMCR